MSRMCLPLVELEAALLKAGRLVEEEQMLGYLWEASFGPYSGPMVCCIYHESELGLQSEVEPLAVE